MARIETPFQLLSERQDGNLEPAGAPEAWRRLSSADASSDVLMPSYGMVAEPIELARPSWMNGPVGSPPPGPGGAGPRRKPGEIVVTRYKADLYLSATERQSPAYRETERRVGTLIVSETVGTSPPQREATLQGVARAMNLIANAPLSEPAKWKLYSQYIDGIRPNESRLGLNIGTNVSARGANPYTIDAAMNWNSAAHMVQGPGRDTLHFGKYFDGAPNFNVVLQRIMRKEANETLPQQLLGSIKTNANAGYVMNGRYFNRGDANASMQLTYAWYKANQNTDRNGNPSFKTFSDVWQKGMLGRDASSLQQEFRVPWNNNTPPITDPAIMQRVLWGR
jgi:hypothetical protein